MSFWSVLKKFHDATTYVLPVAEIGPIDEVSVAFKQVENDAVTLPFIFRKNEQVKLVFLQTQYFTYVKYQGAWRRFAIGTGILVITDKSLYFDCQAASIRIAFRSVITCKPYSDGFDIRSTAKNALPRLFITGESGEAVLAIMQNSDVEEEQLAL